MEISIHAMVKCDRPTNRHFHRRSKGEGCWFNDMVVCIVAKAIILVCWRKRHRRVYLLHGSEHAQSIPRVEKNDGFPDLPGVGLHSAR
jgi:hypothetical protein